jgi:protein-tyrosine sulfotransferase
VQPAPLTESIQEQHALNQVESHQTRPVFILGIAERSGTTYLQDLLRVHPDCDVDGMELEEDHFVTYSDLLVKFVNLASQDWKDWWGPEQLQKERELVCRCLGDGLISYLQLQVRNRRALAGKVPVNKPLPVLVTKTPDVTNLHLFFKIFPDADLLILVRDGRSVVESAVKTFYRSFAKEAGQWAERAAAIHRFASRQSNCERKYLIVRYEDLYANTEVELRRVMAFLRLDPTVYDFARAMDLPVRGSSSLRREGAEWQQSFVAPGIHWNAVPKTADFCPLERWSHWSRAKHERFNWIAGKYLALFGYEKKSYDGNRWLWSVWNVLLDLLPIEKLFHLMQKVRRETTFAAGKRDTTLLLWSKLWRLIKSNGEESL